MRPKCKYCGKEIFNAQRKNQKYHKKCFRLKRKEYYKEYRKRTKHKRRKYNREYCRRYYQNKKEQMVKTRKKGLRVQRKGIQELENKGYNVSVVERTGKYIAVKDLWGLFDVAAIKDNKIRFIQFKTNTTDGFVKKLEEFNKKHRINGISYELWVWFDYKGFKKYIYSMYGFIKNV